MQIRGNKHFIMWKKKQIEKKEDKKTRNVQLVSFKEMKELRTEEK